MRAASFGGLFTFELFASVMSAFVRYLLQRYQNALLLIFR